MVELILALRHHLNTKYPKWRDYSSASIQSATPSIIIMRSDPYLTTSVTITQDQENLKVAIIFSGYVDNAIKTPRTYHLDYNDPNMLDELDRMIVELDGSHNSDNTTAHREQADDELG